MQAHVGTCQICARAIGTKTGLIAHHGYTRPGLGDQTGSCMGARKLPFEKSRDVLGFWIDTLAAHLVRLDAAIARPCFCDAPEHRHSRSLEYARLERERGHVVQVLKRSRDRYAAWTPPTE